MSRVERPNFDKFLCDTWWYGLTQRVDDKRFEELAKLRAQQGFNTVQMVVGIPPEVGPENPNASSKVGPAWNLRGEFNQDYLKHSRERVEHLNSIGLSAVLYGAWGQQIEWLGEKRMKAWWSEIVKNFDDLDVMYCLTGESDIWVGEEKKLIPNKSTGELNTVRLMPLLHPRLVYMGKRLLNMVNQPLNESRKAERHNKWSRVLTHVSSLTDKPIFIHVLPNMTSEDAVNNPQLLDAITVQTGHSENTRRLLWELPLESQREQPGKPFVNLEPWYEGITSRFKSEDQLYAYWTSMMAGAYAFCYGAHGIWNAGDGRFLAHWGKQTMSEAMKLSTPQLLGKSHRLFLNSDFANYPQVEVEEKEGELVKITRAKKDGRFVVYVPEVSSVDEIPEGDIFSPLRGELVKAAPKAGQVVFISK
jgi:hypothetical protein